MPFHAQAVSQAVAAVAALHSTTRAEQFETWAAVSQQ
jgi:hypothetical protein